MASLMKTDTDADLPLLTTWQSQFTLIVRQTYHDPHDYAQGYGCFTAGMLATDEEPQAPPGLLGDQGPGADASDPQRRKPGDGPGQDHYEGWSAEDDRGGDSQVGCRSTAQ